MEHLYEHRVLPAKPDNPIFMNYMGYDGDIDPTIADMMPVTKWSNMNGVAFADEEAEEEAAKDETDEEQEDE